MGNSTKLVEFDEIFHVLKMINDTYKIYTPYQCND